LGEVLDPRESPAANALKLLAQRPVSLFVFRRVQHSLTVDDVVCEEGETLLIPLGLLDNRAGRTTAFGLGPSACAGRAIALRNLRDLIDSAADVPDLQVSDDVWSTSPLYSPKLQFAAAVS
jgi:hypothetical protein